MYNDEYLLQFHAVSCLTAVPSVSADSHIGAYRSPRYLLIIVSHFSVIVHSTYDLRRTLNKVCVLHSGANKQ